MNSAAGKIEAHRVAVRAGARFAVGPEKLLRTKRERKEIPLGNVNGDYVAHGMFLFQSYAVRALRTPSRIS